MLGQHDLHLPIVMSGVARRLHIIAGLWLELCRKEVAHMEEQSQILGLGLHQMMLCLLMKFGDSLSAHFNTRTTENGTEDLLLALNVGLTPLASIFFLLFLQCLFCCLACPPADHVVLH